MGMQAAANQQATILAAAANKSNIVLGHNNNNNNNNVVAEAPKQATMQKKPTSCAFGHALTNGANLNGDATCAYCCSSFRPSENTLHCNQLCGGWHLCQGCSRMDPATMDVGGFMIGQRVFMKSAWG